jgi:multimeric flavodoxin WrbA
MKKAVVIFGSPRKNSNTAILVNEAIRGMEASGIQAEVFYLNELQLKGCQACYYCKEVQEARCKVKDDMAKIMDAINNADGILVASPIYWGHVTAQTKTWLDRMFPYIDMKVGSRLPRGKTASFIFTQNQANPDLFLPAIESFKMMLGYIGFAAGDTLIANDLDKGHKPMATENPAFMEQAFALGLNFGK